VAIAITRWKCQYCKKHFSSKNYAEKHEKKCYYDEEKKACPTCKHFDNSLGEKYICWSAMYKELECFTDFLVFDCPYWEDREERGGDWE
jgi:hypothetical protein